MYNWKGWRSSSNGKLTQKGGRRRAVCSWRKVERKIIVKEVGICLSG